jgi:hypothetical protein
MIFTGQQTLSLCRSRPRNVLGAFEVRRLKPDSARCLPNRPCATGHLWAVTVGMLHEGSVHRLASDCVLLVCFSV